MTFDFDRAKDLANPHCKMCYGDGWVWDWIEPDDRREVYCLCTLEVNENENIVDDEEIEMSE